MKSITTLLSILTLLFILASCQIDIGDYNTYAVVYGISDYNPPGPGSEDLNFSDDDAVAMDALLSGHGYDVTRRTDVGATYTNLLADLDQIKATAGENDLFVLYFSGHGCQTGDSGGEPPEGDANAEGILLNDGVGLKTLLDDELGDLIKTIPCLKKIVIIDACNSGGFIGNELETEEGLGQTISLYTNFADDSYDIPPSDALVISASAERELSYEAGPPFNHGIFTYYLLESADDGDHNGDGHVTALEAYFYAREAINGIFDFAPRVSGGPVDFILF